MSTKIPSVPLIVNPKGLEKAIQQLQERITTEMPIFDYVFGLADTEIVSDNVPDDRGQQNTIIRPSVSYLKRL